MRNNNYPAFQWAARHWPCLLWDEWKFEALGRLVQYDKSGGMPEGIGISDDLSEPGAKPVMVMKSVPEKNTSVTFIHVHPDRIDLCGEGPRYVKLCSNIPVTPAVRQKIELVASQQLSHY